MNANKLALFVCLVVLASPSAFANVCDGVAPSNNTGLQSVVVASGITAPIYVTSPPGDTNRFYIVQQNGVIRLLKRGETTTSTFLDISSSVAFSGESGLLGMAFSPDFDTNGEFYVNYTNGSFGCLFSCRTFVSRFNLLNPGDPDVGDPASEQVVLELPQPQSNHNGGQVSFGPDGFLYIFLGDGGGANDAHGACGNAQDLTSPLGKILRIDVDGVDPGGTSPDTACYTTATGYTVPSDNPFSDGSGGNCDEVWAYGLRNPWRNGFDSATDDLYVGDVGQQCWEEINYVQTPSSGPVDGGENYGWNIMEGDHCFNPPPNRPERPGCSDVSDLSCGSDVPCNDSSLTMPVLEYQNDGGAAVIGGYVYRGCRMPNFDGTYFYGDNGAGWVRSFEIVGGVPTNQQDWTTDLGGPFGSLTSFGEDARGEIYMTDAGAGVVRKILPPFVDLEVSGSGAADAFLLNRSGNWTWEDLEFSTMHPVDYYRVYRGTPNGSFDCIHTTCDPEWPAGDSQDPASPGDLQAYVVTAVSGSSESSTGHPGTFSVGTCTPPVCP